MKNLIIFVVLLLSNSFGYAQLLEENAWNTYEGSIGNTKCQLSIYFFSNRNIKGNYIFKNSNKEISVSGYLKGNAIFLTDIDHPKYSFKANIFSNTQDKIEGVYIDSLQNKELLLNLHLESICWSSYPNHYTDINGTKDEIEDFACKVKKAIVDNNKEWIAGNIRYPFNWVLKSGYSTIHNKLQLIKYYDQVFTVNFKQKIKEDYTTNLFNKDGEVMLGNGEIWIGNPSRPTDKNKFIIASINPVVN